MAIKLTNNKKKYISVISLICILALLAGVFMIRYPSFKRTVSEDYQNPVEQESFIEEFYKSSYVLYRDLYEKTTGESIEYNELYLSVNPDETIPKQDDFEIYYGENSGQLDYFLEKYYSGELPDEFTKLMQRDYMEDFFDDWETEFGVIASYFDYKITDKLSQSTVTNSSKDLTDGDEFYEYISLDFDANGNVSNLKVKGEHPEDFLKLSAEVFRKKLLDTEYLQSCERFYGLNIETLAPKNCIMAFGITYEELNNLIYNNSYGDAYSYQRYLGYEYMSAGVSSWFMLMILIVLFVTLFWPISKEINLWKYKIFRLPLEGVAVIAIFLMTTGSEICSFVGKLLEGIYTKQIQSFMQSSNDGSAFMAYTLNYLAIFALFLLTTYGSLCLREIRQCGFKEYIKKRCYIYKIFPFLKGKVKELYHYLLSFDVGTKSNKIIIRILIANAIVLSILCVFWVSGIALVVLYSIFLYFFLRKYVNDLKSKYNILYEATNKIAEGNLNVYIKEDLGLFEPFKPQIAKIQEGFRSAVEEEVKSQRMKTDLITNVSHDLKTPLTAIITYINLLKEEGLTEEQRKEYLDTLERKSLRLKVLIEDLFEVSKASSNTITLDLVQMDLMNLLKQVEYEVGDKLKAANLDVRMNFKQEKVILNLDSQKTYRIYENLFNNVAKYALQGTRVFVDAYVDAGEAVVTIKNISASEITVNPADLTERFVRGDVSRNTEGSGLGLAIAKSFTDIQGGKLIIESDGDLFKVTTVWPLQDERIYS